MLVYSENMEKHMWSRSQLFILSLFGSALSLLVFAIFFNGYATANTQSSAIPELNTEIQNETIAHDVVPNITNPLSAIRASFDFDSDASYQRFLTNDRPFHDVNYEPSDLAPINSNFTSNDARKFTLRKEAGDMFADMAWHFWHEFK
jgi:hypothetical protein